MVDKIDMSLDDIIKTNKGRGGRRGAPRARGQSGPRRGAPNLRRASAPLQRGRGRGGITRSFTRVNVALSIT